VALPRVPANLLAEGFRRAVLDFLVKNEALSKELRARMLAWRHGGFSAHNEVSVAAEDAEGRKKLAGTMLRAPMSVQKMTYDAASGTLNLPLQDARGLETPRNSRGAGKSLPRSRGWNRLIGN
jgi:hypothetical protein